MPPPTANEIKTQLKTLLTPIIGTAPTKKVKIIDYLALAFKPAETEDPAILRSSLDPVTLTSGQKVNRINCLMISEESFTQSSPPKDAVRRYDTPRDRIRLNRRFRLTYFYQFGANSENTFSTNVELMRTTLNANPKLGFALLTGAIAGPGQFIEEHDRLQMPVLLPDAFGDTIVHVAEGLLTVNLIEPL